MTGYPYRNKNMITIVCSHNKKQVEQINFNNTLAKHYLLDNDGKLKYKYISMGYNKTKNIIGIKLLKEANNPIIYKLHKTHIVSTSIRSFLKHYNLIPNKTKRYMATSRQIDGITILYANLNQPIKDYND
tara:strand:+ start:917 stop:1306 length:390 start_codon:yes stop_codon:yes gene_type:complete